MSKSKAFVFEKGICPEDRRECEFKISTAKINWIHKHGPDDKFYNIRNLPFALNRPVAIFKGLKRDGHDTSYCYIARPVRRFVNDTASLPTAPPWVFMVFIDSNLEVFNWRFEKDDKDVVNNYSDRFGILLWPIKAQ